jgi:hypothetical protein
MNPARALEISKETGLPAVGTTRPWASATDTVNDRRVLARQPG